MLIYCCELNTGFCAPSKPLIDICCFFFSICVPFPFQNKENWKCLLTSTNVSALCLDFDEVSAILQALHISLRAKIKSTFATTDKQNNRYDSFETRHFDEGKPCGEPPSTSLVQRSRMLMQKEPCCPCLQISHYSKNRSINFFHKIDKPATNRQ